MSPEVIVPFSAAATAIDSLSPPLYQPKLNAEFEPLCALTHSLTTDKQADYISQKSGRWRGEEEKKKKKKENS